MNSKMEKNYNSVSVYDKCDNLVSYVEFEDNDQELKCYYSVNGKTLSRKFTNNYVNEPSEVVSSVIEYNSNIMLFPLQIEGETSMRTIQSGMSFTSLSAPGISSRIDVYKDEESIESEVQCFSVNSNLIDEWLDKV